MSANNPGSGDRLAVTLLFSVIAHAVIALGVTFAYEKPAPRLPSLDVILVQTANGENPAKADFLAQASNRGGGDSDEAKRPAQTLSGPLPKPEPGVAPTPLEDAAPQPSPARPIETVATSAPADFSVSAQAPTRDAPDWPVPIERDIEQRRVEMARLADEIQKASEHYAKRPKRKYISANTREYAFAAYMRAWVARIERVGNLNYPDAARRQQLSGQLLMTVCLDRSGKVKSIDVIHSSGHKLLDDAAVRITRLAEPFPPLPETDEKLDELYITRTWQFLPDGSLQTH